MNNLAWLVLIMVVVIGVLWLRNHLRADVLAIRTPVPAFSLPDAKGQLRSLSKFRGEWVLLYFYPKDDTPGCTKQACAFRDGYLQLRQRGVQVLGVSLDDSASHQAFAEKYRLPFPLLSDTDGQLAKSYGALWSLGPIRFARRHSFLIDSQGQLAQLYRSVKPDAHYRQVLSDLDRLVSIQAK